MGTGNSLGDDLCPPEIEDLKTGETDTSLCLKPDGSGGVAWGPCGGGGGTDELVKVSANDATAGFLLAKLVGGDGVTLVEVGDGGNESLRIDAPENFSYSNIPAGATVTVPEDQQMSVFGEITAEGELVAIGEVVSVTGGGGAGGPDNFSYAEVGAGETVTVPEGQQMTVIGEVTGAGEIVGSGEVISKRGSYIEFSITEVLAGESFVIPPRRQMHVAGEVSVAGELIAYGEVVSH